LCRRLGGKDAWRHLSASHLQELLPLDAQNQERLSRIAETERWTVARVRAEVDKLRRVPQKRAASLAQATKALGKLLARHRDTFGSASFCDLDESSACAIGEVVAILKAQADALEERLRKHQTLRPSQDAM
jgi:hypothetical protein